MYVNKSRTCARRHNVNINLFSFMQLRNLIILLSLINLIMVLFIFFGGIFCRISVMYENRMSCACLFLTCIVFHPSHNFAVDFPLL